MSSTNTGMPSIMFPPTIAAVETDWFEVAASFDSRINLPRVMAICAVDENGTPLPSLTASCVHIELPGGLPPMPMVFPQLKAVQNIDFPVRWKIKKPVTDVPATIVMFGTGISTAVAESVVIRDEAAAA
jgi:hypothetical protein